MLKMKIGKLGMREVAGKSMAWLLAGAVLITGGVGIMQRSAYAADVIVYKSPTCGCCQAWVSHLRENGFSVQVHDQRDVNSIKTELGVPPRLRSCHTAMVGGYVVEGHVPAREIQRLLKEKPQIKGLAVPGMPMGSPGMEGPFQVAYDVLAFQSSGDTSRYASYDQTRDSDVE